MTWTDKDDEQAQAEGWMFKGPSVHPTDAGKFRTGREVEAHLQQRRYDEKYVKVNEQGGIAATGNTEGFATRALAELDRRRVASSNKQFLDVGSAYGAPMGRRSEGDPGDKPMSLFKVKMVDGDYDDGGAYWGGGRGVEPLYCLRGEGPDEMVQHFVRAKTRTHAYLKLRLQFPELKLKSPIHPRIIEQFDKEIAQGLREEDGTAIRPKL